MPFTRGQALTELFGLSETEEMLGFIHLGTPTVAEEPTARPAIDLPALTIVIDDNGTSRLR